MLIGITADTSLAWLLTGVASAIATTSWMFGQSLGVALRGRAQSGSHYDCETLLMNSRRDKNPDQDLATEVWLLMSEWSWREIGARLSPTPSGEAVMYRHHPQTARIRQLVTEELGELHSIHTSFRYTVPDLEQNIRSDAALGGGVLRDGGSYCVSICNLLAGGEPVELMG